MRVWVSRLVGGIYVLWTPGLSSGTEVRHFLSHNAFVFYSSPLCTRYGTKALLILNKYFTTEPHHQPTA